MQGVVDKPFLIWRVIYSIEGDPIWSKMTDAVNK